MSAGREDGAKHAIGLLQSEVQAVWRKKKAHVTFYSTFHMPDYGFARNGTVGG